MAATIQVRIGTGASVSYADASGGMGFNQEDSLAGTSTPVQVPTSANTTNYSYIKSFVLYVTGTASTNISNRRVAWASNPPTGLYAFWKDVAQASYAQAASGNQPAPGGSNGAVPSGYTLLSTTPALWDNTSTSTGTTGAKGDLCVLVAGVGNNYTGGAGSATSMQTVNFLYDEA